MVLSVVLVPGDRYSVLAELVVAVVAGARYAVLAELVVVVAVVGRCTLEHDWLHPRKPWSIVDIVPGSELPRTRH